MTTEFDPKAARDTLMAYHGFVSDLERLHCLRRTHSFEYRLKAEEVTGRLNELREDTLQRENLAHYMGVGSFDFETAESILNTIEYSFLPSTKISEFSRSLPTLQDFASSSVASA